MVISLRLVPDGVRARVGEARHLAVRAVLRCAVGEGHALVALGGGARLHGRGLRSAVVGQRAVLRDGNARERRGIDRDLYRASRDCVFLIALRWSECPFGLIVLACIRLDCAVRPRERTVDGFAGVGILHLAQNSTLAQRVAVGDLDCGDFAVRRGLDLVHRVEDERQLKVLVIGGGDFHLDGTDRADHCSIFRIETCQGQHTVVKLHCSLVEIISTLLNKGNISTRIAIVAYRAVTPIAHVGQQLLEVIGVRQLRAVDHVQRAGLGRGRGGLFDLAEAVVCAIRKRIVRHAILQLDRGGERNVRSGISGFKSDAEAVVTELQFFVGAIIVEYRFCRFYISHAVVGLLFERYTGDPQLLRRDGHGDRVGDLAVFVALSTRDFVVDTVRAGVLGGGDSIAPRPPIQRVLHRAVLCVHAATLYEVVFEVPAVDRTGDGRWRGDRAFRDAGLGDGQLLLVAGHRIAVLAGGEINAIFPDRVSREVYDVVPVFADHLIFSFLLAVCECAVARRHSGVDVYLRVLRIAAGAELDGRAALHLWIAAGQVLAIDLQIQGLGGDGQSIDDNIVQLRAFDIIPGIPLVGAVRVEHLVSKCCVIQNRFPRRALCQRQCADHGRITRPGEFRTIESNDFINAGCGRVLRVAQGGGDIVTLDALDRHRALDGMAVQIKSRLLRAVDGIIAGHIGQQREF